jgi:NTE family protein
LDQRQCAEKKIEVLLSARVVSIDPSKQRVVAERVWHIEFGQALIATGASATRLRVPGAQLAGIHHLRSLNDADNVRHAAARGKRGVVIGASFLGLEVAATLTQLGIKVSVLEQEPVVLSVLRTPAVSDEIRHHISERGVQLLLGEAVAAFGGDEHVSSILTQSGAQLPCDFVVVAIGVTPNVGFLAGSGVRIDDGVVVDRFLRTDNTHIFAAGDVANIVDPVTGLRSLISIAESSISNGAVIASNPGQATAALQAFSACLQCLSKGTQVEGFRLPECGRP